MSSANTGPENGQEASDPHAASAAANDEANTSIAIGDAKETDNDTDGEDVGKNLEEDEEDEDSSSSQEESEGNDDDGIQDVVEIEQETNVPQTYEELLPVTLNLRNGEWHLKDQITWPVTLPCDVLGQDCQEYVEYCLKDPKIDVFALRTVEDMDFPVGFDLAIAKAIRAHIMAFLPVIWKERQSVAIQERKNMIAQRRTGTVWDGNKMGASIRARLLKSGGALSNEDLTKAISSVPEYPVNAVRRLFAGTGANDEANKANGGEEAEDVDEEEAANMKKRKKLQEEETTGRRKRKRGTAFEAHVLLDERISIRLNIALAGVQLQDQFDWDPSAPLYWAEIFARRLATELGLPREFELAIAHDIKRQVLGYLAFSSHQLPSDWHHATSNTSNTSFSPFGLASSSSNISASNSASETILIDSPPGLSSSNANNASESLANSTGGSSSGAGNTKRKAGAESAPSYVPTRSLPILSLHNVIRPLASCSSFSPQLSAHPASKATWESFVQKQNTRSQRSSTQHGQTNHTQSSQHAHSQQQSQQNKATAASSTLQASKPIAKIPPKPYAHLQPPKAGNI